MRRILKQWKRPILWGLVAFSAVTYGNACAPNFSVLDTQTFDASSQSCKSDESLINAFASSSRKQSGYFGSQKVDYIQRDDNWIQVDGDMLVRTKGGTLPSKPIPEGLSQGVGVRAADRWPNGTVPYVIASDMPAVLVTRINSAIRHWNANLSGVISLVPRTTQTDYVMFTYDDSGCASSVGYLPGEGAHPVLLSEGCDAGNVAHEIGHVVGLDHEQNRLDRNSYVTINFANVSAGYSDNFGITTSYQNYNFYDFSSIMHYSLIAFSSNGSQTITPKVAIPSGVTVGQRSGLSTGDINSVRLLYGQSPTNTGVINEVLSGSTGLIGTYYNSYDFTKPVLARTDSQINFDWGTSAPVAGQNSDTFSMRWTGYLTPPTTGTYYLVVQAMDELRLLLNGQTVFEMTNGNLAQENVSLALSLTAGTRYSFLTEYRANTTSGSSYLRLYWRKPGGAAQELIPEAVLTPDSSGQVASPCSASWSE